MTNENLKLETEKKNINTFGNFNEKDFITKKPALDFLDKIELLEKIENEESVRGLLPTLKWTHRTNIHSLLGILESKEINSNSERGINFFLGNGYGYGDVQLIMKDSISTLPPAKDITGEINQNMPNVYYFVRSNIFLGKKAPSVKDFSTLYGEFRKFRAMEGDNPNINVPYLSIGGKNTKNAHKENSVGIHHIEAVMLPKHLKKNPKYKKIIRLLSQNNIKILELETDESELKYLGKSLLWHLQSHKKRINKLLDEELDNSLHNLPIEVKGCIYLGILSPNKITQDLSIPNSLYIKPTQEKYEKESVQKGLSRGQKTNGGNWKNKVGEKNSIIEEKAYLKYLVESRFEEDKQFKEGVSMLNKVFSKEKFNHKHLLDVLEKYFFPKEFKKSIGVWEGYTLKEHTKMVLNQFEKYFSNKKLPDNFDKNLFRLTLTLHDIGKPFAVYLGNKKLQHKYTHGIIRKFFSDINKVEHLKEVLAILYYDPLGNYIQGNWSLEGVTEYIDSLAKWSSMDVNTLFNLIEILYKVDAGSYTKDAGGIESLDYLFIFDHQNNTINFNNKIEEKVQILRKKINLL